VASPTLSPTPAQPATSIPGDGTFRIGVDVQPGTYRSPGPSQDVSCSWHRLSAFSESTSAWIDSGSSYGQQYVTIAPSDVAFWNQFCETWTLVSPAPGGRGTGAAPVPAATAQGTVLPDADSQGFTTFQGAAHCHGSDQAAQILRTPKSAVVVCQATPNAFYYRGLRLSDNGMIELGGAIPTGAGFTVTNTDGTVYEISRSGLVIRANDGQVYTESAVESAP
jgi:hypothetical protein